MDEDPAALYRSALAAARVRDEQLAAFAHDLRNPMNALAVSAEVLRRAAPDSPEARSAVAIIGRQVTRLAQLVDQHLPRGGAPVSMPRASPAPAKTCRVGLIDIDAPCDLRVRLERDGCDVLTAGNGPDGLSLLLRDAPDVAIVALELAGFDGQELAWRSRAAGYRGRLIALSDSGRMADVERSLAAGFDVHLQTPVPAEHLTRLLMRG